MEWTLFALLQMFIITVGVSLACWMRMRGAQRQNQQLREHLEGLEEHAAVDTPSPEAWLNEQIEQLPADDTCTPVLRLVLQHVLQPVAELDSALRDAVQQAGLVVAAEGGEHDERIAELEAALEAAKAAAEPGADGAGGAEGERNEELKTLLQQFTRDSREMMACIQTLEAENAQLREQLGDDAPAPATTEDAA